MLMAAVSCLLLIACLNLSNLLVARTVARRKEIAMRSALGGSRVRLICEQITECVLICLSGGALGIYFAALAVRWLVTDWLKLPRVEAIHIDAVVLSFAVGITFLAGLLSGILPAMLFAGSGAASALQDSARTSAAQPQRRRCERLS